MTSTEMIKQAAHFLEMHYDVKFPNGYSKVYQSTYTGQAFFTIGLIDNQQDCSSNIRDNDIGFGKFKLSTDNDGNLVLERLFHALTCNPVEKHHALSHQRISYRKIKANSYENMIEKFDKYLTKFSSLLSEKVAENEIYNQSKYNKKYFEFN